MTIKELAEKAGVSFSTVAKALNNNETINIETRRRIQSLAKKYNYRPNILAKGLRNRHTQTIGVILNDLQSPFYSEIYKAIGDILYKNGYTMYLADSKYDETTERKNILTMIGLGVEGLIISAVNERSNNLELLLMEDVKTVFIDNRPLWDDISCVYVDHTVASYLATKYLITHGHKKILLLNGPVNLPSSRRFYQGYLDALKEATLPVNPSLTIYDSLGLLETVSLMNKIWRGNHRVGLNDFTAIITLSDLSAIGIYEAALNNNFSIPRDYSVVGYDNIFGTEYLSPPLTTIHQPKEQTGSLAVTMLLNSILSKAEDNFQIILNPTLIERQSVLKID
ncbi:MAG: LacI family DNA-binding transcriptional regulator [Sphaerochaetaceae bacterium]